MDFQTIQSGKATTIARLIEAIIILFLLSTRLPSAARLAGKSLSLLSSLLQNPLAIFVVFNSIILVLFLLSRLNPVAEERREKVEDRESLRPSETDIEKKQGADLNININAVSVMPRQQRRRSETDIEKKKGVDLNINVNAISVMPCQQLRRSETDIEKKKGADLNINVNAISVMPRQQLRRSETDIEKKRGVDLNTNINAISVIDRVDTLSNEEFQRTIEEFIAKRQRFLWAQKMAEIDQ